MLVDVGGVKVGSERPIVVQSMTNTDTADIAGTVAQVNALHAAGSELVRVTVNNDAAAQAVPEIVKQVQAPVIGDFHYNGHVLLTKYPECAKALAKYRINPGNVGGKHHDDNFTAIVKVAVDNGKPVRIGVNWGSLDQNLLTEMMDANSKSARAALRARRDHERHGRERHPVGRAGRADGPRPRPHHPLGQGLGRPGPGGRLPHAGAALRLSRCTWA